MPDDEPPRYHTDPFYREAIHRYLGWLAAACLIASLHAGPVTIFVWIAVAIVLTRCGRNPPNNKCNQNRRRRC